jgi:uncharacterized protein (TIGR00251 family)
MNTEPVQQTKDGILLRIKLVPRSTQNRIDGRHGDAIKIRLNAPPVDGKANAALIRFIAGELGISASAIAITSGETSRNKTLRITGIDAATATTRLLR